MSILVKPITDIEVIRQTITAPSVWKFAADDLSGDVEVFTPKREAFYLGSWGTDEDGCSRFLGMFMCSPVTGTVVDLHTCLLPAAWGEKAKECAHATREWIWQNTPYTKVTGAIPANNRLLLKFTHDIGMSQYGVCKRAWLKNGKTWDLILVEVNKEAPCQQQ